MQMQSLAATYYAIEFPTFGEIVGVSMDPRVQWISLALGKTTFMSLALPLPGKWLIYFLNKVKLASNSEPLARNKI